MNRFYRLHTRLLAWPRGSKRVLMLGADIICLPLLLMAAYAIRLDQPLSVPRDWFLLPLAPVLTISALWMTGYYRAMVRYLGSSQVWAVMAGVSVASIGLAAAAFMLQAAATPRSIFVIYWLLGILYFGGSRFLARRYLHWAIGGHGRRVPVAVFGAGQAGIQAAMALQNGTEFLPVAFVDDNPQLHGSTIQGIRVVSREGLRTMAERQAVETVLLSMPSLGRARRMEIVRFLEGLHLKVKSVPGMSDIIHGRARLEDVRDVAVEDLLGRDPVPPDEKLLSGSARGKRVLVTGAGGSIGSELCRQLIELRPRKLVLFEMSEFGLYAIERELQPRCRELGIELFAVLGSVANRKLVRGTISRHDIQTVYHAAAYKHVPIVEENVQAGVENNVFGTLVVAEESERAGVERCVLISTDKAVRPTNVMGASKRLAEMALQALADRGSDTIFSMVRFGNVLGSSGSVVPVFREQIRNGGPVTVTHPEVIRYFMTIPEAAQLVIQAGTMAKGGEVFVLDMGEPVRIYDLACTMIHLMGFTLRDADNPEGDIEVVFSGLRPGEKLYEELLIGENSIGTPHPGIMLAREEFLEWNEFSRVLTMLRNLLLTQDDEGIRMLLSQYVNGYRLPLDEKLPARSATVAGGSPAAMH